MKRQTKHHQRNQACTFETLEERQHFSVYSVTNHNDSGAGSLRQAITSVNADSGTSQDTIKFAIASGAQTIILKSALPDITHSVLIAGGTQPGYNGTPLITLDVPSTATGLSIKAANTNIGSLNLNGGFTGISVNAGGVTIDGNTITSTGGNAITLTNSATDYVANNTITDAGFAGIYATGSSTSSDIDLNTINRSVGYGIYINSGATGNSVESNQINNTGASGIFLVSSNNTVDENYIGDSGSVGIDVFGSANMISQNSVNGNGTGVVLEGFLQGTSNTLSANTIEYNKDGGVLLDEAKGDALTSNTIALNDGPGVTVDGGNHDKITQNQIYSNELSGISLIENGNGNQPAPLIDSSTYRDGTTTITGKLLETPKTTYTLEFFGNPRGDKQGAVYLGSVTVKTSKKGIATFTTKLNATTTAGETVTATATSAAGDTSVFSNAVIGQAYHNPLLDPARVFEL